MAVKVQPDTPAMRFLFGELEKEIPEVSSLNAEICLRQEGKGYTVRFSPSPDGGQTKIQITYDSAAGRNRALFTALCSLPGAPDGKPAKEDTEIHGEKSIRDFGVMLDMARNAAMSIPALKQMIRTLAFWGYTYLGLYVEDVLKVEGEPYFGYMRGAYTKEEIRELDAYAAGFGMELRPYIQTLAHLNQITRYRTYRDAVDTGDILLVGSGRTRELLEHMFRSVSEAFSSRNINIGMDEAHMVGLGQYLDRNGYEDRTGIILKQLDLVLELCRKYGLKPQMWSDMFFRLAGHGQYSEADPEKLAKIKIPDGLTLVYWDYYSADSAHYDRMLENHRTMTDNPAFAAGAWKWGGFAPRNAFSIRAGKAALEACRRQKIQDVVVTAWGDDGAEAAVYSVFPVFWKDAAIVYGQESPEAFRLLTGYGTDEFTALDGANPYAIDGVTYGTCCKYLLYNDPLQGAFDSLVRDDTGRRFAEAAERLHALGARGGKYGYLFETLACLDDVLAGKADLGVRIRRAYEKTKSTDKEERQAGMAALRQTAGDVIPKILGGLEHFYMALRAQWMRENKPFGFEVQTIRLGGLMLRLRDVKETLLEYADGKLPEIGELEEKQLAFGCSWDEREPELETLYYNDWEKSTTAGRIGF